MIFEFLEQVFGSPMRLGATTKLTKAPALGIVDQVLSTQDDTVVVQDVHLEETLGL